jgi:pimeloyl-ACP methyl ester carboxylesterase
MSTQTARDRFLERDGARLRWRIDGAGPCLVLLHGWPLDLEYWDPAVALLAERFKLLRFDRCGFGRSSGQPDIHRNVADLAALMAAAGQQRAVLLGMSQGARLALHFVSRHPQAVRGLVLDGAPVIDAEPELPMARFRQLLASEGIDALRAEILRQPFMRIHRDDAASRDLLAGIVARYPALDLQRPAQRAPAPPELAGTGVPTLILNGSLDSPARREAGRRLQATIADARRIELPGAGHLALLDDPAGYAAALTGFCATLRSVG